MHGLGAVWQLVALPLSSGCLAARGAAHQTCLPPRGLESSLLAFATTLASSSERYLHRGKNATNVYVPWY